MTEQGLPFDGTLLGDATNAPYSAAKWARAWKLQHGAGPSFPNYGVFAGSGDGSHQPLDVRATSVLSSNVEVQVGAAQVDGRFYETTAAVTLAIAPNASGNPRIDTVILRLDYVGQTIRLAVKQGSPAGSPVRQAMQQDAFFWEIPLADVAVANGFTTLAQSTITQRQRTMRTQSMGWQSYAYPPQFVPTATENGGFQLTPAQTALVEIVLTGNMLLEDVTAMIFTTSVAYQYGWDLYFQDTNDGNTAENTIRRVAQSNGDASGTLPGSAGNLTLAALGGPVPLTPGIYWLAWQNRHASNNISISQKQLDGQFHSFLVRRKTTTNPNGATLDAVTSWSALSASLCLRLRGRIFGQTTVV